MPTSQLKPPRSSGAAPAKLFVETTTRCNLNCVMCVKQNKGSEVCEGDFQPELFAGIVSALPRLEALVLNGIGEPLLNPHLESFIRTAKSSMPTGSWVGFQTNGVLMTPEKAYSLVEAGLDKVCISIDAIVPEHFRQLREGGEIESVERAFGALNTAMEQCGRPDVQIGVEFVAMRENIRELPSTLEWAAGRGARFAIVTHVLPYDERHAEQALFSNVSDEALALFEEWRATAAADGIDIRHYRQAIWRFRRSRDEQAVVDAVEAMKADGERRGIMLDMKKLFQLEQQQLDETAGLFAAARDVADRCGIDLRLPEVTLSEKRKCSFVEEGSAFVSWNGDVSPCYFLWHRYDCFASGWSQTVRPKVFGNVGRDDILTIWNSTEYASFRSGVLAYDYPSCASCGLSPCDYLTAEEFEQDCHISSVPCGSCLWCTGVFQCLR
ncbi:MAG TPA: radical SAM/SPASM family putative metalloenzyme maturase [Desulfuromonadales bacterium]|nr:radical SAM/SPASM family putative metalloenzyme maturase [Desulfuromonadales bacterium]